MPIAEVLDPQEPLADLHRSVKILGQRKIILNAMIKAPPVAVLDGFRVVVGPAPQLFDQEPIQRPQRIMVQLRTRVAIMPHSKQRLFDLFLS